MKKFFALLLVFSLLLNVSAAFASDVGIQIIGGPEEESTPVSLDDMKVGETAKIDGFGETTILKADFFNNIYYGRYSGWYSGDEAEYLYLKIKILNTQKKTMNYLNMFGDVICDFGDGYQFGGWYRQRKADTDDAYLYKEATDGYEISPLYAGQYFVVVTLPNFVVDSKEPLSVTFKIGDNEFTYHHRR